MNIYEKLKEFIVVKRYRLSITLFSDDYKQDLDTDKDIKIFDLLKNISSLAAKISDENVEFTPYLIMDGKRTFAIEDITEDDYNLLSSLDMSQLPLNLKARVADILWTQKKNYKSSILAAESYFDLYNLWFCNEDWLEALDMIKRAICISAQVKNKVLYEKSCQSIYDHVIRINGKDEDFLSLSLVEILLSFSYGDFNKIIDVLDVIIASNFNNPLKNERAYSLKVRCSHKLKKTELAKQTNIDMADYFVNYAEYILRNDPQGPIRSQNFFEKAIFSYRNNGEPEKAEVTHKRLVEIQREIPKLMKPIVTQFDNKSTIDNITKNMDGLSFEKCVIRLTQLVSFYEKETFKKKVIEDLEEHPLAHIFANAVINADGQTIFTLPGLKISNPEENLELLDLHIHRKILEYQKITGNMYLRYALTYISEHFDIEKESLDFLIDNNFIIPSGREYIIRSAIVMALNGQYYEALHILAPQAENIFRNIAKEVGGLTVTLDTDGTSKEKVLSSIFDLPELIDCYDNDILFLFKGLLNEQAGANIRNEIAHGILSPYSAYSGEKLYFICVFIKLLVVSSLQCQKILHDMPEWVYESKNSDQPKAD